MVLRFMVAVAVTTGLLAGCASSKFKARKEQRDKLVQANGLYCEMINGDIFPDVDVQTNIEMAKRCDPNKPFSITNYRAPTSDTVGLVYCCAMLNAGKDDVEGKPAKRTERKSALKSAESVASDVKPAETKAEPDSETSAPPTTLPEIQ